MLQDYTNPFHSFWMAGFECSDQLNNAGNRVDFLNITNHLSRIEEDYHNLHPFGIKTVREGIRWSQVEKRPYQYDFSTVALMINSARLMGIQQIWDICHFGYPDDLTPLHPHFVGRFAALCSAFAKFHRENYPDLVLIVTPVNEVSFISWLGGEVGGTSPFCTGKGWDVKYRLMKAYIAGIYALKAVDVNIRILTTEPLVNIVPPLFCDSLTEYEAKLAHEEQFQSVDMLAGKICPELGGSPDLLDLLGFNFYYNNQWVLGFGEFLPWLNEENDERWRPLSSLLCEAYDRYKKPIVLSETSHPGEDRPLWIKFIAGECQKVIDRGVPLFGVCIYPVIDRPDWDNLNYWHQSGLWDEEFNADGTSARVLNDAYAQALIDAQQDLKPQNNLIF